MVKWGDNVADIEPLLPLYKTEVFQLAAYLGVTRKVLEKAPSPDLIPGIVDGLALGIDYGTMDEILWGLGQGWAPPQIVQAMRVSLEQVQHVREMHRRSEHLRTMPPQPALE